MGIKMEFGGGEEHYSCDDEDYDNYDNYDNLTSVSQNINNSYNHSSWYGGWSGQGDDGNSGWYHFNKPSSTPSRHTVNDEVDMESSSQVARSIVSSIFRKIPTGVSSRSPSQVSALDSNTLVELELNQEVEQPSDNNSGVMTNGSVDPKESKESTKCEEEDNAEGHKSESVSQVSEGMNQELQNLDITQNSFKDRITEWINTVTIKDATINTDTDKVEDEPSTFAASTPIRNS